MLYVTTPKLFGIISILCATVLFAAALDIGHLGLADKMGIIAAAPLGLYALLGLAALFMSPKPAASAAAGQYYSFGHTQLCFTSKRVLTLTGYKGGYADCGERLAQLFITFLTFYCLFRLCVSFFR